MNKWKNKNILIVDDSPIICNIIKKTLIELEFTRNSNCLSTDDAIKLLKKEYFDLVLLDYNMPGNNGEYLLNFIKKNYPDIIVIMLSSQQEKDIVVKLMRKADNYIIKDEISEIINDLVFSMTNAFETQELKKKNIELMNIIKKRNKSLEEQLETAKFLLKEIMPDNILDSNIFKISIYYKTMEIIGGDFYSVKKLDKNKIGVFLADICGHGIQAALLLFTLNNAYNEAIKDSLSAKDSLQLLNLLLLKRFPESLFTPCCYLILDEEKQNISFSAAFENPILYVKKNNEIAELTNGKLSYLGLVNTDKKELQNQVFFEETILELQKNEKIFIFTDGITETKNYEDKVFGLDRIKKIIAENYNKDNNDIITSIYNEVKKYSNNNISDDITIICIEKK